MLIQFCQHFARKFSKWNKLLICHLKTPNASQLSSKDNKLSNEFPYLMIGFF